MTLAVLIQECMKRNIHLAADGEVLCYKAPPGVLTPELRAQLTKHRPQLVTLLNETSLAALPWECSCRVWPEEYLDREINQCDRCGLTLQCLFCFRCRACWLIRVVWQRVKVPPKDER
jgi:hypothetical protein